MNIQKKKILKFNIRQIKYNIQYTKCSNHSTKLLKINKKSKLNKNQVEQLDI